MIHIVPYRRIDPYLYATYFHLKIKHQKEVYTKSKEYTKKNYWSRRTMAYVFIYISNQSKAINLVHAMSELQSETFSIKFSSNC